MRKRMRERLMKMHPARLIRLALDNDADALDVLIDRQQSGRALRFYLEPRHDLTDDGYLAMSVRNSDDKILLRSGRPNNVVVLSRDAAVEMIEGLEDAVRNAWLCASKKGVSDEDVRDHLNVFMDENIEIELHLVRGETDHCIEASISPGGAPAWSLGFDGCGTLMSMLIDKSNEAGWDIISHLTDKQQELINAMIQIVDS